MSKRYQEKTYYTNLSAYELTEDPSNLVPVEEYFCNPFAYPIEVHHATDIIFEQECGSDEDKYKEYFKSSGRESIDVKLIVPTQRFLKRDKLENWVYLPKDGSNTYPEFMKFGSFYYLLDGHHRVAKDIEGGYEFIEGCVILVSSEHVTTTESVKLKPYKSSIYEDREKTYYHITPTKNISNILSNGIKTTKGKLYLTDDLNFALEIGTLLSELRYKYKIPLSIVQIEGNAINGLRKDPEFPSGGYYITYNIKPDFIKNLGDFKHLADKFFENNFSIPFEVGDEILMGKFKNKRAQVKGFGTDAKGQPTVVTNKGETPLFKFRISKLIPPQ